jgi:hypothetical protein
VTLEERLDAVFADFWEVVAEIDVTVADQLDGQDERTRVRDAVGAAVLEWLDGDVCFERLKQLHAITSIQRTRRGVNFCATLPRPGQ